MIDDALDVIDTEDTGIEPAVADEARHLGALEMQLCRDRVRDDRPWPAEVSAAIPLSTSDAPRPESGFSFSEV